ncbi:NAD(P)H-dependent oxidoreductase [Nocardiopsis suaedae]|uniref:NAD(P)H-dependent oxidoreductase n=1 Tax=Nocardiopsis suaedae TaxID=3018444 RepID=A0ABT4TFL3_9ACTN|nr:NAD(P)H-dependent oxidoreductase [Nocardiopsis suaedae]MDA2803497.1 NAD(P)H-dependent oxidoreductase [Nocardiopsis suaedae]
MNVLWVFAHPDARSLNGALRDTALRALAEEGHSVRESDLYAMEWNPVVTPADFGRDPADRLRVPAASRDARENGTLAPEIVAEQEKLLWADTVVVQFPLWWYGVPAILKGWFDRVLTLGFGYGVYDPGTGRALRYGEGPLSGRRALAVTTVGARETSIGPRGVNGAIEDILFPLNHGTFWYTGMDVLPPVVVHSADRSSAEDAERAGKHLAERVLAAWRTDPIPFRSQNGGDYDDALVLRPELAPGEEGNAAHLVR